MPVEATVCKVVDLQEIPVSREASGDMPPLKFRIEVRKLHGSETYDAIVYRLELFKLTTSFDKDEDGSPFLADYELFVVDDFLTGITATSADETIKLVEQKLSAQIGRTEAEPQPG